MPRLLFVDKDVIDDTARTNLYTGGLAGSSEGTSISLGYVAEAYIDFGTFGMFAALLAIGLLYGAIYRVLSRWHRSRGLLGIAVATAVLVSVGPYGEQLHQGLRRSHRLTRRRQPADRVRRAALGAVVGRGADAPASGPPRHPLRVDARRRTLPGDRHHGARLE